MIAARSVGRQRILRVTLCLRLRILVLQTLDWRQGALHIPLDEEPQKVAIAQTLEPLLQHAQRFPDDGRSRRPLVAKSS